MKNSIASLISRAAVCAIAAFALTSPAQAQWSWKDAGGSRVFSDQPPPPSVADKDILKRPLGSKAPAAQATQATQAVPDAAAPAQAATQVAAPKPSGKDSELEKKKKEAETKAEAQKKADAEKNAAAKKDNCDRAQRSKAGLDSGVRISTAKAKGEREPMGDAARAAETKRLQEIIASDCS